MTNNLSAWLVLCLLTFSTAAAQAGSVDGSIPSTIDTQKAKKAVNVEAVDSLLLSPGDQITVHVLDVPDLDQAHLRVTDLGEVPLLFIGSIKVQGLTPGKAAAEVASAYVARNVLRLPNIQITVDSYAAANVTVFGHIVGQSITSQVRGISIPLVTPRPLLAVLAMAGGFAETASRTVTIQRHDSAAPPLKVCVPNDPVGEFKQNVLIYPGDTITVPRAGIVYVLGNVGRPMGVYMSEDGALSLLQALSQSGSPLPTAQLHNVRIFRRQDATYAEIHVNVGKIVDGKLPDISLSAQDVVWVPFSFGKNLLVNGASIVAAVSSATATGFVYTR